MIDIKRLRQKILDLAIRGKLVPQDPADEPASVLLERIHAEKLQMVADGKLKKKDVANNSVIYLGDDNLHYEKVGDSEPVCIEDELPFELPEGWAWSRLSELATVTGGKTPSTANRAFWDNGVVPWVTSKDMKTPMIHSSQTLMTQLAAESMKIIPANSILLVTRSGILRRTFPVAINAIATTVNQDIKALIPHLPDLTQQIYLSLISQEKRILTKYSKDGTTVESIDFDRLYRMPVPVPPLAEQQRIVSILYDLLARIDIIEREQTELEELLAKTRSKVLDLAIRGKLVPQDPADEPASILLERIHQEKLQMVADGKLKKKDVAGDSVIFRGDDNSYYERKKESNIQLLEVNLIALPYSWEWTRLGTISNYGESPSVPAHQIASDAWILDLEDIEKGTGAILRKVLKKERDSASAKRPFVSGQLLYSKLRPYLNKVLVAPAQGFCTSEILPVQLYGRCAPKYLRAFCRSPFFLEYANRCSYGVKMPRLGTRDGKKALIALPPLREQQRIAQVIDRINIVLESTK